MTPAPSTSANPTATTVVAPPAIRPPKFWKMALVTWLCLYPLINLMLWLLWPYMDGWPMPARTLVLTLCMVPIMTLLVGTLQIRLFHWLRR